MKDSDTAPLAVKYVLQHKWLNATDSVSHFAEQTRRKTIQLCLGTFLPQAASRPSIQPQEKIIFTPLADGSHTYTQAQERESLHVWHRLLSAHFQIAEVEGASSEEGILLQRLTRGLS